MYQRTGALFQRPFGRIRIESDAHFRVLIAYIHQNPQKHGFVNDFRDWPYSSYQAHLGTKPTRLRREDVLAWFDGKAGFIEVHQQVVEGSQVSAFLPEDFET